VLEIELAFRVFDGKGVADLGESGDRVEPADESSTRRSPVRMRRRGTPRVAADLDEREIGG
jgi:hypothetical protein